MRRGLTWVGVELEQKFVDLGQQNIDLWNETYGPHLPGWGSAVLLRGDSRNLAQVVAEAGAVVSSPPYAGDVGHDAGCVRLDAAEDERRAVDGCSRRVGYGSASGQLAALPEGDLAAAISSPPYSTQTVHGRAGPFDVSLFDRAPGPHGQIFTCDDYGSTPGQLGQMPEGDIAATISSPPYAGSLQTETPEQTARKQARIANSKSLYDGRNLEKQSPGKAALGGGYGSHPAQLGQMRDGGFDAAVSSPPFEGVTPTAGGPNYAWKFHGDQDKYGSTEGNIGNDSSDTFWAASRLIIEQVYQVLRPGGVAIFVTKAFVRKGKRVDFPGQWRTLCEACGFVTLHQHRAWLVEDRGAQYDLMGELHHKKVSHISFFRRLAQKKGSPPIDYEVVICLQKPPPAEA